MAQVWARHTAQRTYHVDEHRSITTTYTRPVFPGVKALLGDGFSLETIVCARWAWLAKCVRIGDYDAVPFEAICVYAEFIPKWRLDSLRWGCSPTDSVLEEIKDIACE